MYLHGIVPVNYHFLRCINFFCQYINVQQTVLYPTMFLPYAWTSVLYYNMRTRSACLCGISSSRHDMKLKLVPVIPHIKELPSVVWTSSHGWCINYRPKTNFYLPRQQLTKVSLLNLFYEENRFFEDCRAFLQSENWRSNFRRPNNWSVVAPSYQIIHLRTLGWRHFGYISQVDLPKSTTSCFVQRSLIKRFDEWKCIGLNWEKKLVMTFFFFTGK